MDSEKSIDQSGEIARPRVELPVSDTVVLRQFVPSDAAALFALIDRNLDHLSQFGDTTAEKYPDLVAVEQSIIEPPNPDRLRFGIWDGKELVGTVNITPRDAVSATLGYWIGSEFTGRGYATEATDALSEYGHDQLGYLRIYAGADPGNTASIRVLEKSGFVRLGESPEQVIFVSNAEYFKDDERQTEKEKAIRIGLRGGEAIFHDGLKIVAMRADGSKREIAQAEDMDCLWPVAVFALENE